MALRRRKCFFNGNNYAMFFFVFFVLYDLRLRRRTSPLERRRRLTRPLLSTVLVPPARANVVRALSSMAL